MRWLLFVVLFISVASVARQIHAETLKSTDYTIQTGLKPTPTPLKSYVQIGFIDNQNAKPLSIKSSTGLVDYGPINPTNPIKRKLNISVDEGGSAGYQLYVVENHPLRLDEHVIADTTCDNGDCDEKHATVWVNPFTFGLGFSFDDSTYQQFADESKKEAMETIMPGEITIKLNASQSQYLSEKEFYENTIRFLVLPKF